MMEVGRGNGQVRGGTGRRARSVGGEGVFLRGTWCGRDGESLIVEGVYGKILPIPLVTPLMDVLVAGQ